MKFRKKPIIVEAEQYQYFKHVPGVHETRIVRHFSSGEPEHKIVNAWIDTLEGIMDVKPGDWIITGVNGEKYPCKPDIFEKTYEAVNE